MKQNNIQVLYYIKKQKCYQVHYNEHTESGGIRQCIEYFDSLIELKQQYPDAKPK